MSAPIILPQWGMGMNDGEVIKWLKAVGDPIAKGDQLVEIESSKVNAEVEATTDGTLGRIDVEEGRVVDVGTVLGHILEAGDSEGDLPDAAPVAGSASTPAPVAAAAPAAPAAAAPKGGKQIVTPRARRLAKELGVDLAGVTGTGPSGRVTEDDVKAANEAPAASAAPAAAPLPESVVPVKEVVKLTGLRGTIARRMSESAAIPSVTLSTTADVTDAVAFQRELVGEWRQHKIRPQYQDLVIAAVAKALKDMPVANAHLVGDEIRILDEVNVGVAMAIPEGLLVPVIKNADQKSLLEIAQEVRDLAKKAKANSLSIDEMTNSTFSITNLSSYNINTFDPLLNPPEIGILGVGTVEEQPAVVDGEVAVRSIANLNLAFDHRAWDGAPAAEFVRSIAKLLSDPSWMKA
ncbi:dihydrolipoamide acetyltransferase family protein [Candidatus Lucifugimonas marina]|jgi:pyruvate dehydrogenase E2 component (dihydrolipoamide acetyltransferase)|uniref:Dihydrolipoamide acetyltransferase component of pyruvate dehydrogenase complex n=1 Tax=Candidatus Lucifugimonas marina TaxID=3038979 RepID=A0AAJ5ZFR6_9CHLR|nr:2-oxo acid dehydrogenase subunit E2 [SAR202 cluster bacterium JH702]MDG0869399.1 2-oxo acid dehydrogenase subunit E2 [SAR202 cluster bacterium JH639]WFG34145.1 2-oxo acid dehydrogenase subunit E2 [SAR202 cluster bacterium JH545]WFG38072.1 2-oxo acid dehydrogenase subunit E2 [SAR202 cluster bacterium JH1073]